MHVQLEDKKKYIYGSRGKATVEQLEQTALDARTSWLPNLKECKKKMNF